MCHVHGWYLPGIRQDDFENFKERIMHTDFRFYLCAWDPTIFWDAATHRLTIRFDADSQPQGREVLRRLGEYINGFYTAIRYRNEHPL
jgi:hypothetical protein